jgi:hypothetical protein
LLLGPFFELDGVDHLRSEVALEDVTFDELAGAVVAVVLELPAELVPAVLCSVKDSGEALVLEEVHELVVANQLFFLRSAFLQLLEAMLLYFSSAECPPLLVHEEKVAFFF